MSATTEAAALATAQDTVRLTTAQALVRFLAAQWSERDGVRRRVIPGMFGIYGHGNVSGLGEALTTQGVELPFYMGKNEQSMVHAAMGFAKATERLSTLACTASIGPGSTNMITGAATATINRIPVLLFPSDTFANRRQGPVLQQLENPVAGDVSVNDSFRPVSRFFDRIARPEQLLTALPEAIRVLLDSGETGAVTLALHQDVQGEAVDFPASFFEQRTWPVIRRPPAAEEVSAAIELLRLSERPLIIAGGGVRYSNAGAALRTISERFGIPICETFAGKGIAAGADLLVGGVGVLGTTAANELASDADVVLCVGTRLSDFITASHSLFQHPDVRFVGINTAAMDSHKLGATPITADAKLALEALTGALEETGWSTDGGYTDRARSVTRAWDETIVGDLEPREGERMSQGQVVRALDQAAGPGDFVVGAAGTALPDLYTLWDASSGSTPLLEFGNSCMGHEIPAALGIRLARPDAGEVYVLIGDGTYLMGGTSELVTARQEGTKVTVVVIENEGHQSIHGHQERTTAVADGTEFRAREPGAGLTGASLSVDYAANARSLGCVAFDVASLDDLRQALKAAKSESGPCLIAAHVEPRRQTVGSSCWWDLGVAQESTRPEVQDVAAEHARASARQRFYY